MGLLTANITVSNAYFVNYDKIKIIGCFYNQCRITVWALGAEAQGP